MDFFFGFEGLLKSKILQYCNCVTITNWLGMLQTLIRFRSEEFGGQVNALSVRQEIPACKLLWKVVPDLEGCSSERLASVVIFINCQLFNVVVNYCTWHSCILNDFCVKCLHIFHTFHMFLNIWPWSSVNTMSATSWGSLRCFYAFGVNSEQLETCPDQLGWARGILGLSLRHGVVAKW